MSGTLLSVGSEAEVSQEEAQYAAYEKEREVKARLVAMREAKTTGTVIDFLKYVVEGEQDKAEELLKVKPGLVLEKGAVTDLSKREFEHITGFQYALWALDWHMWRMLLKYLPKEKAALQLMELEEKGTVHGKHFSLLPLIEALNVYVKNHDTWWEQGAWDKMETQWSRVVGANQVLLPVHVVHEYCHLIRSFKPCPEFKEETLLRSTKLYHDDEYWFTCEYNGGKLGEKFFAIVRSDQAEAMVAWEFSGQVTGAAADAAALQSLWKVRQQQLEALRIELQYVMDAKGLLNVYFPPMLSSTVLDYFA